MAKSKRIVAPFTNQWGDVINPGDKVFAITVCTGRTNVDKVEYVGYIQHSHSVSVQVRRPHIYRQAFYKGTDQHATWPFESNREVEWRKRETTWITTLQYNRIIPCTVTPEQLAEKI